MLSSVQAPDCLELLKLMVDENYIDLPMIERIVEQWQYENDTPNAKWKEEYRRLFEHDPPTD